MDNLKLYLSLEGLGILELADDEPVGNSIYILLTDTKTRFSKLSKIITKAPFNHVSIGFDSQLKEFYTYALVNQSGFKGGLKKETWDSLKGSNYSLYEIKVPLGTLQKIKFKVKELEKNINNTSYNHLGLLNALFKKNIFNSDSDNTMFCSEFVVEIFKFAGVELFNGKNSSTIQPYDLVRSRLLKFVKRGKIK